MTINPLGYDPELVNDAAIYPALGIGLFSLLCLVIYIIGSRGAWKRSALGVAFAAIFVPALLVLTVILLKRTFDEYPGYEWVAWGLYSLAALAYLVMLVVIIIEQRRGGATVPTVTPEKGITTMSDTTSGTPVTGVVDGKRVTVDSLTGVPTSTPAPKVVAAANGAGLGAAVTVIAIWGIETAAHIDLPVAVEGAALVIISYIASFAAGYIKRP